MITTTLKKLFEAESTINSDTGRSALAELAEMRLTGKVGWDAGKLVSKVRLELEDFGKQKQLLIEKVGTAKMTEPKDGSSPEPTGDYMFGSKKQQEELNAGIEELFKIEIKIEMNALPFEALQPKVVDGEQADPRAKAPSTLLYSLLGWAISEPVA